MASASQNAVVDREILLRHPRQTELLLKTLAALCSVNGIKFFYGLGSALHVVRQKSVDSILDDLWYRAKRKSDNGSSTSHCLDHNDAKWLRPIDGKQQGCGITQKFIFFRVSNLPDELNQWIIEQRLNDSVKKLFVNTINFGRDLQWHAHPLRNVDSLLQPLFRRGAAEKRQVFSRLAVKRETAFSQTVMHSTLPVHPRQRFALRIRNRNHGHIGIRAIERRQVGNIKPSMQGCNICYLRSAA